MVQRLSSVKWKDILLAVFAVYFMSFILVFIVVFGYALALGFQARGAPDPAQIIQFANQVGPWGGRLGVIVFAIMASARIARRVETAGQLHGLLIGAVIGLSNLLIDRSLSVGTLSTVILAIGAGWLGSTLAIKAK